MVRKVTSNSSCHSATACKVNDAEPPPAPQIRVAIASAGVAKEGSQFWANSPPAAPSAARDPAYIEIGNWEPGTTLEMINKSANPTASFDKKADIIKLEPTGRDVTGRVASVWLTNKQMQKLDLDSGHSFQLRAVDSKGNCSTPVPGRLQGDGYGQAGRLREPETDALIAGSNIRLLDGEGAYDTFLLKHIADTSPPVVKHFQKALTLSTEKDGNVTMASSGTLEEGARVNVVNGRTGQGFNGAVDAGQGLTVPMGNAMAAGDTIFVTVSDVNGNAAQKFEVRYSPDCKDGKGSSLGILAARLPGAIKRPKA